METQILQSIYNQLNDCSLNTLPQPMAYKTEFCSILQLAFNEGFLVFYSFDQTRLSKNKNIVNGTPIVMWAMSDKTTNGIIVSLYDGTIPEQISKFSKQAGNYTKQSSDSLMMYTIINMGINIARVAKTLMFFTEKKIETRLGITPGISPRFFIDIAGKEGSRVTIEPQHYTTVYSINSNDKQISGSFDDPFDIPVDLANALELAA